MGQISSIDVDKKKVSNVIHEINTRESFISVLPFWHLIMRRVSRNPDLAKLLFRFVTEYLIVKDSSWKTEVIVNCSCGEKEHKIIPSQWLSDLLTDSWVPFKVFDNNNIETIASIKASKEGLQALFSSEELDALILRNPNDVSHLLTYFHFDELDLKIKLQSIVKELSENQVRKEVSSLIDISNQVPNYKRDAVAFKEAIDKVKTSLELQPIKDENKIVGENVEQVIEKFLDDGKYGFKPTTIGSDIEIWPVGEGWDCGLIELKHYWMEIKFTSGERAHVSKAQGLMAREKQHQFVLLVVENKNNLRERLKVKLERTQITMELSAEIMSCSHLFEDFNLKIGDIADFEEVEPDINGYWVKRKCWGGKEMLNSWIKRVFTK